MITKVKQVQRKTRFDL